MSLNGLVIPSAPTDGMPLLTGLEAKSVLNAATVAIERLNLIDRAELAVRSALRVWRKKRHDRLYGNVPAQPAVPRTTGQGQTEALVGIVQTHRLSGADIFEMHGTAAIKIDAAEYAFTMMLAELRGVMSAPPTARRPSRAPCISEFVPVSDFAVCAA